MQGPGRSRRPPLARFSGAPRRGIRRVPAADRVEQEASFHAFSPPGLLPGLAAPFVGGMFLNAYLLVAGIRSRGDVRVLLLGPDRIAA